MDDPVLRQARRRVVLALGVLAGVVVLGTAGFVLLEGVAAHDALYFTLITVFAVGFAETVPLDGDGRALTGLLVLTGVGTLTLTTAAVVDFLVEGHLRDIVGRRRMDQALERLDRHTIIVGFGRVGRRTADDLLAEGARVCVVDVDADRLAAATARGVPHVLGDGALEAVLQRAAVSRAQSVVACTNDDAENILVALTAKGLAEDVFLVVRLKDTENEPKALRAGADRVIAPAAIGGHRIAALVLRPSVVDFLDVVTQVGGLDLVLEEITLAEGAALCGRRLRDAGLREQYGVNVVAVRERAQVRAHTNADPDHVLEADDLLVLLGRKGEVERLVAEVGIPRRGARG